MRLPATSTFQFCSHRCSCKPTLTHSATHKLEKSLCEDTGCVLWVQFQTHSRCLVVCLCEGAKSTAATWRHDGLQGSRKEKSWPAELRLSWYLLCFLRFVLFWLHLLAGDWPDVKMHFVPLLVIFLCSDLRGSWKGKLGPREWCYKH